MGNAQWRSNIRTHDKPTLMGLHRRLYQLCELTQTDHGGCKLGIATVSGAGAYGALRTESGVHRAQAVPFNDSKGRMQTATATVAVLPEATEVSATATMW